MIGMRKASIAAAMAALGACATAETVPSSAEDEAKALPGDVAAFIERREACDHFRGEEPYDAEREAFLIRMLKETCTGTDAELARLREIHAANAAVIEALADFEDSIEFMSDAE